MMDHSLPEALTAVQKVHKVWSSCAVSYFLIILLPEPLQRFYLGFHLSIVAYYGSQVHGATKYCH